MNAATLNPGQSVVPSLLRGEVNFLARWIRDWQIRQFVWATVAIFAGGSAYGFAMGLWRSPLQASYVAIKFPLVMLATAVINALLNGMLAPLLGVNLRFRESLLAILMSFVIAAVVLGAMSPLMMFVVWNTPSLEEANSATATHGGILLLHVACIAVAGIASNLRLMQLLQHLCGSETPAKKLLLAWCAGNMFVGAQVSWILRPFIGSPQLTVEFLRHDAFHGNFYEAVFHAAQNFLK